MSCGQIWAKALTQPLSRFWVSSPCLLPCVSLYLLSLSSILSLSLSVFLCLSHCEFHLILIKGTLHPMQLQTRQQQLERTLNCGSLDRLRCLLSVYICICNEGNCKWKLQKICPKTKLRSLRFDYWSAFVVCVSDLNFCSVAKYIESRHTPRQFVKGISSQLSRLSE